MVNSKKQTNDSNMMNRQFRSMVFPEFFSSSQQQVMYKYAYREKYKEHVKTTHTRKTKYDEVFRKHEVKDQLPFRCLDDFMAVEGLDLKDVYSFFGQEIGPMRSEIKVIIEFCSLLSETSKEELLKTITLMTPTWWREIETVMAKPSYRVYLAHINKSIIHDVDEDALRSSSDYKKIIANKRNFQSSNFFAYPDFARMLNVSLRWLLRDVTFVYTKDEKTESIIDAFYFLRPEIREAMIESFQNKISEKKGEDF